jgi:glycosyltransferase involved in cell wall biosynthesis
MNPSLTIDPTSAATPGLPAGSTGLSPGGRPLHVLTVRGDLRFGGDETRTLSFAREVNPERVRNTIVTVNHPDTRPEPELGAHYAAAGIDVLDLGEGDNGTLSLLGKGRASSRQKAAALDKSLRKYRRLVRRLCALIRDLEVDVIDAHGEIPSLAAVTAGHLTGRPVAVTSYHLESRADSKLMWLLGQFTWGWADTLISDSYFAVDLMRRFSLRQPRRLLVVRNGVFRPDTAGTTRADARRRLGLPEDPAVTVIGQVSRLDPFKGHRYVIEAMPAVLAEHPATWFAFVGYAQDPTYRDQLWNQARELGVDHRLTITSHPGNIGQVFPAIDVQVHASLLESLPIAIAEGMSLAKPAVVTDVAGTREEVTDRETGLVVPPGDPDRLAAALSSLLDDPEWAAGLGAAAAERYEHMFQPAVVARTLEHIFWDMACHAGRR